MKRNDFKAKDNEYIVGTYGRFDLVAEKGKGLELTDIDGKEYLDFTSGIGVNSLGFSDDRWVDAVTEQLKSVQHTSNLYYTKPQILLAETLVKRTGMKKAFFCNSGAEANEAAIKAARKFGGKPNNEIITLKNSFHGRTMATVTATGQDGFHKDFDPFLGGFSYCEAGNINELKALISDDTCAVMMELVQGEGGVIALDKDFVREVSELAKERNILLVIDEVQTGIGRTGKLFAYEHYDISPDIVTFAKGIGGGLPIGGALFSEKCCDVLAAGDHGSTFGGNPVCCAGALEVLNRLDDDFLEEVSKKSEYMREKLSALDGIDDVTGLGLMIGLTLSGKKASDVVKAALDEGLMLLTAKDKVRLLPPLVITYEEIDRGIEILKKVL